MVRVTRFGLLAMLMVGMFSPVLTLPVIAEGEISSDPIVEVSTATNDEPDLNPGDPPDGEGETGPKEFDPIVLVPVIPEAPLVEQCGDSSAIQVASGPAGVAYSVVGKGDGTYAVEARLIDPAINTWAELADAWVLDGDVAKYPVTLKPCANAVAEPDEEIASPDDNDEPETEPLHVNTPDNGMALTSSSMEMSSDSLNLDLSIDKVEGPDGYGIYSYYVDVKMNEEDVRYEFTMSWSEGFEYNSVAYPYLVYDVECDFDDLSRTMTCGIDSNTWVGGADVTHTWLLSLRPAQADEPVCKLDAELVGSAIQDGTDSAWTENNTASSTIPIGEPCAPPALSLAVSPATQRVESDERIQFDVALSNNGGEATGVTVTSTLQAGLDNYAWSTNADGCTVTYPTITCDDVSVSQNGTTTITVTGTPNSEVPPATCGIYSNPATYTHAGETSEPVTAKVTINCEVAYEWTMNSSADVAAPGDIVGFTFAFANTGNTGYRLQLADTLPTLPDGQLWNVNITTPDGVNLFCVQGEAPSFTTASGVNCSTLSLPPGGVIEISATFTVPLGITPESEVCGSMSNFATALMIVPTQVVNSAGGQNPVYPPQEITNLNTTEESVFIECAGISVTNSDGLADNASVQPGNLITYTIVVENTGNVPIDNYTFYDNLDEKTTFAEVISQPVSSSCEPSEGIYFDCAVEGFPPGETHSYVFTAIVNDDLTAEECAQDVTNTVNAFASQIPVDSQPITRSVSTPLDCSPGVRFEMTAVESPVVPGDNIAYTIELENTGALVVQEAVVTDSRPELPDGGIWTVTIDGESGSFPHTVTMLAPGDTVSILIESSTIPDDLSPPESEWCDSWSYTAQVTGVFSNGVEIDTSSDASVRVNCTGLSIEKQVSSDLIGVGDAVTYTITVSNHGNTAVNDLVIEDDIASASEVFSNWRAESDDAIVCDVDDVITCSLDELGPDESVSISVIGDTPTVPTYAQCAPVENSASFSYQSAKTPEMSIAQVGITPAETVITSNAVSTRVDCQPSLEISSVGELQPGNDGRMDAGDSIAYTITVENTGNMAVYDIAAQHQTGAGNSWGENGSTTDQLQPGESIVFTDVYQVSQSDLDAGELSHTASTTGSLEQGTDQESTSSRTIIDHTFGMAMMQMPDELTVYAEATASLTLTQVPTVDFEKSATTSAGEATNGDTVTFSFTVTNNGNVTLTDMTIDDPMEGLEWSSEPVIASLAPGETAGFTATYIVTESNVAAGQIVNRAEVTATDPVEAIIAANDSVTIPVVDATMPDPEPEPTEPATPTIEPTQPATPGATPTTDPTPPGTSEAVIKLPETGAGGHSPVTPIFWAASFAGTILIGISLGAQRRRS